MSTRFGVLPQVTSRDLCHVPKVIGFFILRWCIYFPCKVITHHLHLEVTCLQANVTSTPYTLTHAHNQTYIHTPPWLHWILCLRHGIKKGKWYCKINRWSPTWKDQAYKIQPFVSTSFSLYDFDKLCLIWQRTSFINLKRCRSLLFQKTLKNWRNRRPSIHTAVKSK